MSSSSSSSSAKAKAKAKAKAVVAAAAHIVIDSVRELEAAVGGRGTAGDLHKKSTPKTEPVLTDALLQNEGDALQEKHG